MIGRLIFKILFRCCAISLENKMISFWPFAPSVVAETWTFRNSPLPLAFDSPVIFWNMRKFSEDGTGVNQYFSKYHGSFEIRNVIQFQTIPVGAAYRIPSEMNEFFCNRIPIGRGENYRYKRRPCERDACFLSVRYFYSRFFGAYSDVKIPCSPI